MKNALLTWQHAGGSNREEKDKKNAHPFSLTFGIFEALHEGPVLPPVLITPLSGTLRCTARRGKDRAGLKKNSRAHKHLPFKVLTGDNYGISERFFYSLDIKVQGAGKFVF